MRTFSRSRTFSFALAIIAVTAGGMLGSATVHAQTTGKPMTTPSGLQIIDTKVGAGASPKTGQTCVMHYTGWLYENGAKGKKFDSSVDRGQPFEFPIGTHRVIAGWDEGVATMKVGGKRTLDHSAAARLRRARRRQRYPAERHADLRCRAHRHQGLAAARIARSADPRTAGKSANPLPNSAALNPATAEVAPLSLRSIGYRACPVRRQMSASRLHGPGPAKNK